jgi:hypothetical protein
VDTGEVLGSWSTTEASLWPGTTLFVGKWRVEIQVEEGEMAMEADKLAVPDTAAVPMVVERPLAPSGRTSPSQPLQPPRALQTISTPYTQLPQDRVYRQLRGIQEGRRSV